MRIYYNLKTFLLLACPFFYSISQAQVISGKILSSNGPSIGYARIGILDESIGSIADSKGQYAIDLTNISRDKSVTVQFGGFEPWTQRIGDFIALPNHDIVLTPKNNELAEVVVSSKEYVNKNWGINKKGNSVSVSINGYNDDQDSSKEFALEFSNKKRVKIVKINLNVINFSEKDTLLLDFDILGKEDKLPGNSIISHNLTDTLTFDKIKDGTYSFDISDRMVWVKKQDFFVSVKVLNRRGGRLSLNGALFRKFYYRNFFGAWKKLAIAAPSLNIDVKVEK